MFRVLCPGFLQFFFSGTAPYVIGNQYVTPPETPPAQAVLDAIRTELMTNGPMTVQFPVYEDFYSYSSGEE